MPGEDLRKAIGGIYARLTRIETILETRDSFGERLHDLEIKYATFAGKAIGLAAAAGAAVNIILKII